ncbi:MAG: low specificity L-threonine aldolase [Clostridiales bacterium]|nr:low specificity L-threonine aldolase [Clostridiales bacterium]
MLQFNCDYNEGAHPKVLEKLVATNLEQTVGYGEDPYCQAAAELLRGLCHAPEAAVHFLVGGTQANLTVISAALRTYQGVLAAESAHIHVHETGSIEACGHKVLALPSGDGKITAGQIEGACRAHVENESFEHTVQPKMVYLSHPTELGTLYTLAELEAISAACQRWGLYLYVDGARLGYGLTARGNDVTMADLARLTDAFYIGGTKVGALFGEAVVLTHPDLKQDFRYVIKQRGGMLAKGRLLGLQFLALFEDGTYEEIAAHANRLADRLRETFRASGVPFLVENTTNQLFPILPDGVLTELAKSYGFSYQQRVDEAHSAVRFCTSWATDPAAVEQLCGDIRRLCATNQDS